MRTKALGILAILSISIGTMFAQTEIHIDPYTGNDTNIGTKEKPLKTLTEAAFRANENREAQSIHIILASGIYALDTTATFSPKYRTFTKENRLVIKARINPDNPNWDTGSMPTIIHTMPLSDMWMGRKDPFGGVNYGLMIETSHVTIEGLKILGIPVVEHPKEGYIQRVYPIGRLNPELDDLEIKQCLFAGDEVTNPNHLPILANGTGIVLDHCIFYNVKQGIVYWSRNSTGHAMRNCLIFGSYGTGIWTSAIANDFDFDNNIIANGNYVWISQTSRDRGQQEVENSQSSEPISYVAKNSLFAANKHYVGTGGGPALNFKDIDPSIIKLQNTEMTHEPIELELDQSKRNYLHPKSGTLGSDKNVGLFIKKQENGK